MACGPPPMGSLCAFTEICACPRLGSLLLDRGQNTKTETTFSLSSIE